MKTLKATIAFMLLFAPSLAQAGWFWQNPLQEGNWLKSVFSLYTNIGYAEERGGL